MTDTSNAHPLLRLLPRRDQRVKAGHPWAFSNEIAMTPAAKAFPPGAPVRLEGDDGVRHGVWHFNPHSLIAARRLSRDPAAAIDAAWLRERLSGAMALRGNGRIDVELQADSTVTGTVLSTGAAPLQATWPYGAERRKASTASAWASVSSRPIDGPCPGSGVSPCATVSTSRVRDNGRYTLQWTAPAAGTYQVRAYKPGGVLPCTSSVGTVLPSVTVSLP